MERNKSITDNIFRIKHESFMCGFHCIVFKECVLAGKMLLDYTILFSPNDYNKNVKINLCILKMNMTEEATVKFRLRKGEKTRNYLLDEIKHRDLVREKYKKTCVEVFNLC